jgi:ribosomal protein L25 (general stress protein Ctc)
MKLTDISMVVYGGIDEVKQKWLCVNGVDSAEEVEISEDEFDKLMAEMTTVFHNFVAEKKQQVVAPKVKEFKVGDRVIARDLDIPGHYSGTIVKRGGEIYYISLDIDRLAEPCKVHASQLDKIFAEVGSDDDIEEPEQEEFKVGDKVHVTFPFADVEHDGVIAAVSSCNNVFYVTSINESGNYHKDYLKKIPDCLAEEQKQTDEKDVSIKLTEEELKLREMFPSHYKD